MCNIFIAHPFLRLSCLDEPVPTFDNEEERPPRRAPRWRRDGDEGGASGGDGSGGDGGGNG